MEIGFWLAGCQSLPFPQTLLVVLTTVLRYRMHCDSENQTRNSKKENFALNVTDS